ncbi:MAG: bifunctional 5,10-methylenetetrahydrofolate dehydrogenase/5,10-methenyltetrahydrofolate cyclohydrolase [Ruminococcaceae bacterium]|jgi:methylenetetrahydrofolate dehydrogenase (NADP+)/methenyltetrahydrofolate cyclohydrolase|nr:bifunctional 5,10-methylenetetrahydrofolate dehydrogenase/5,10-methenyltetrahydrofolate cyclohydrolase [Oscillospiraceae bacterium]
MAEIWKGAPVAAALTEKAAADAARLKECGVVPTLAILRVGERADDLAYERAAIKRCAQAGVAVLPTALAADVGEDAFFRTLDGLNHDDSVHGILMLRPLPKQLDGERARKLLAPEKDVDGCTDGSLAGVFANAPLGFPPCTAQAVMALLRHYGVDVAGMRAAVVGRSLVVGRPVALLLQHANATVTVCHTRTRDVSSITRAADLVIAACGQPEHIGADYLRADQIVVDVGLSWSEAKQKLCGDVDFDAAEPLVRAITPAPGGIGSVTTAVLCAHTVEAARRSGGVRP